MTIKELRKMAKAPGIKYGGLRKADLIKQIQKTEGNFDCFGTAIGDCDQIHSLFRDDCLMSFSAMRRCAFYPFSK